MCRTLVTAGFDPQRPLLAFRGDELAMRIKTIEYGAHFSEPENQRSRFFKASPVGGVAKDGH
jgi:hypothetical protein